MSYFASAMQGMRLPLIQMSGDNLFLMMQNGDFFMISHGHIHHSEQQSTVKLSK